MIGLSLLPTGHPEAFQRLSVRSSMSCYRHFNLPMGRSLGFASTPTDSSPSSDSLSLRLRTSWPLTSPVTVTRRLIMQKARRHLSKRLRPLASARFQVLFHSPPGVLFTFPSRYWSSIGLLGVFSLAGWCRPLQSGFLRSRPTQDSPEVRFASHTGLSPSPAGLPRPFRSLRSSSLGVLLPRLGPRPRRFGLLRFRSPLPAESLLFSSPAATEMFQFTAFALRIHGVPDPQSGGFPHSDISGSQAICASPELFAACRVLLRLQEPRHPPCALVLFLHAGHLSVPRARFFHFAFRQ